MSIGVDTFARSGLIRTASAWLRLHKADSTHGTHGRVMPWQRSGSPYWTVSGWLLPSLVDSSSAPSRDPVDDTSLLSFLRPHSRYAKAADRLFGRGIWDVRRHAFCCFLA